MDSYRSRVVANEFLALAQGKKSDMTHMKLQKLVYIAHGWFLVITGGEVPLIEELPEAWQFGPVFPRLYADFKEYGSNPIKDLYRPLVRDADSKIGWKHGEPPRINLTDKISRRVIEMVWNIYKDYTGVQLSALTHKPDTPWSQIWKKSQELGVRDMDIPNDVTYQHYLDLAISQEETANS